MISFHTPCFSVKPLKFRVRYVDTFNKGGGTPTNLFQSPSIPIAKPRGGSTPKFFIPSPVTVDKETVQTVEESMKETTVTNDNPSILFKEDSFSSPPSSTPTSTTLHRFPSMGSIAQKGEEMAKGNGHLPPHSRRTASWSGSFSDACDNSTTNEIKPLGEALGMPPSLYMCTNPPPMQFPGNVTSFGDDLHETQP